MRRHLLALTLLFLPVTAAPAQTQQEPANLNTYRLKAMVPSVCRKLGGKVIYQTHGNRCDLPKVVKEANPPTAPGAIPRPPPVTTQR
jgi:hypothetical protein